MRVRRIGRGWLAALALAATMVASAHAAAQTPQRARLEQQFRERVAQVVQKRLALTDPQMTRLRATNEKFEAQRRGLLKEERQTRQALRAQLAGGAAAANQQEVGRLLDTMLSIHRRRQDVAEAEQKELATYLTPVQRAQYFAIQEQIRRRMAELARQRAADTTGAATQLPAARRAPLRRLRAKP